MASLPGSRTAGFIASPPAVSKPCGLPFASVVSTFPVPSGKPKLHETSAVMSIPGEELHTTLIIWLIDPDETKVKANAPLDANRTAGTIEEQISRMLAEAEAIDAREGRQLGTESNGPAMPKDLGHCADRSV